MLLCCGLISEHKYIMTKFHWLDFYGNEDFFFFTEELGSLFLFYFFLTQTFCFAGFSSDLKSHTSLFFFLPFQDLPGTEEESQNLPLVASSNFELNKEWNSRKSANNSKRRRQVVEPVWHSRRLQPQRPPAVAPPTKLTNQCILCRPQSYEPQYLYECSTSLPPPLFSSFQRPCCSPQLTHVHSHPHKPNNHPSFLCSIALQTDIDLPLTWEALH